jgi:hypothetical protein
MALGLRDGDRGGSRDVLFAFALRCPRREKGMVFFQGLAVGFSSSAFRGEELEKLRMHCEEDLIEIPRSDGWLRGD